ncbi:MAG: hypothetical protein AB8B72_04570 [Crocinitomicaceae bacterium]
MNKIILLIALAIWATSCSESKTEKKGFQVNEITVDENGKKVVGLDIDIVNLETRPRNVLLTNNPAHRITPVYKVNYHHKTNRPYTGSNSFHSDYYTDYSDGNNWHENFMPGFEAMYGYNFVNVSHYNNELHQENRLFDKPVLIKTFYYPTFEKDTLNFQPVNRQYYMASVYDEDSNKDGYINAKDLRRFYYFDINGINKKLLVPKEYSVMSSEYDSANDFMYVFAKHDKNGNGQMEESEKISIFWIDLSEPSSNGVQYQGQ